MPIIAIGSLNPVKVEATLVAFQRVWPEQQWQAQPLAVESYVPDQPMSETDTRLGAINRAIGVRVAAPDYDYAVGLEGGVMQVASEWMECGWICVIDREDNRGWASTARIQMPRSFIDRLKQGVDLNVVCEEAFGMVDVGRGSGYYGIMTNNALPRMVAYRDAVIFALARFVHPLQFK